MNARVLFRMHACFSECAVSHSFDPWRDIWVIGSMRGRLFRPSPLPITIKIDLGPALGSI